MTAARWLGALLAAAALGWGLGELIGVREPAQSPTFHLVAIVLLAVGLLGSTSGISLPEARRSLGVIIFAATVGVALKAALIVTAMYFVIGSEYALLGLVVAQIDPLAVAAMTGRSRMSERARTILFAWASFDDPVTTLLTVYVAGLVVTSPAGQDGAGALTYAGGLGANAAFAVAALLIWLLLRGAAAGTRRWLPTQVHHQGWRAVQVAILLGLLAVAVDGVLMLGLALAGLFFRPELGRVWDGLLRGALIVATVLLGLLLTDGVSVGPGIALGLFAFAAQMVVAAVLPTRLTRTDRITLALGQQNGITAIVLALALEPVRPGTAGIVAPAILVVNAIHLGANSRWNLLGGGRPSPDYDDSPTPPSGSPSTPPSAERQAAS